MRLDEHERLARKILAEAGVDSPGLCSRILTAHAAGLSRIEYILSPDSCLSSEQEELLAELVARRSRGEPLAYILGFREFYSLPFLVSPATLTPRPETELLVELALEHAPKDGLIFADLGCGSGCIGETLLSLRPGWTGALLDNSAAALAVAGQNAASLHCSPLLVQADIFHLPFADSSLDLVVSNPPYISESDKGSVMAEVLAYEPHSALFSPANGLAHLDAVIKGSRRCLKSGGLLLLEHGAGQEAEVAALLAASGFTDIEDFRDLAGLPRCAMGRKTGA